jgi:hypothetical protein
MSDNKLLIGAMVIVVIAVVASLVYVFIPSREKMAVTQPVAIPQAPPRQAPPPKPAEQPPSPPAETAESGKKPGFVLPRLDNSDQLIRDGVVSLTRNEGINAWLGANQLIRRCVSFIDNVAHGNVARQQVPFLAPDKPFKARQISDNEYEMDESSYDRYDLVTNIFVSIDSKRAAEFYVLVRPLFQKAYAELGYPDDDFDKVVFSAIGRLLETPAVDSTVKLVRPVVMYKFADPKLEALSAAQKQLIRMGPKNSRAIKTKLGDLAAELRSVLEKD